ncbi:hypothetical protein TELCIR_02805 [Teladorsagia circumcincta]|uniref:Uncharacterized protein n=1 Tax=Teladorsagia circumcincta TaxID=45464 RepID=A0A2G9UY48_TELCI|nr:hypothetical protein TELCIR_02805 [Teladorsagia circumcincta]
MDSKQFNGGLRKRSVKVSHSLYFAQQKRGPPASTAPPEKGESKLDANLVAAVIGVIAVLVILVGVYCCCCGKEQDVQTEIGLTEEERKRKRRDGGGSASSGSSHSHTRERHTRSAPQEAQGASSPLPQIRVGGTEERPTQGETMDEEVRRPHRRMDRATQRLKRLLRMTREDERRVSATAPTMDDIPNILDAMGSVEGPGAGPAFGAQPVPSAPGPPGPPGPPGAPPYPYGAQGAAAAPYGAQGAAATPYGRTQQAPGYEGLSPYMHETQRTEEMPRF